MLGAIIGDVVGSVYEFNNIRTKDFPLLTKRNTFTDDTILTIAIVDWLLNGKNDSPIHFLQKWGRKYLSSYGGMFNCWLQMDDPQPYNSFGNGSAMRISPIAYLSDNMDELKDLTIRATIVSHNHPEGIKGALVTATCVYMALHGSTKEQIKEYAIREYPEIAEFDYETLRRTYQFNETCQMSVPQAIYCFLISTDFEDCIRTTISIGGDCDTTAAISGAIAGAFYKIPDSLVQEVLNKLTTEMIDLLKKFDISSKKKKK